ncbi:MAG: ABC transporter substrate-binding protein [Hyphomicrobiales bacterium]|nr:ABC transporter substrate-binding protein [Hyphomicrobiales bacterium]
MRKLFTALTCAALSVAVASTAVAEPKRGGTLTFSYRLMAGHFNPAIASGTPTGIPGTQLFAALLRFDDKWNPHPYLAESWNISDDGLTVTVKLRDNAHFHDGHDITSEDVKFSIETYKAQHPFKPMYAPVESIDTPDKLTTVFHLSKPHPAILLAFSSQLGVVIPKHIYGEGDIRKNPRNSQDVVGSGPFKLKEHKPGEYMILERNDDYFMPGLPYVDRIVYKKIVETTSQTIALEKGDVDMTAFAVDPQLLNRLKKNPDLTLTPNGYSAIGPLEWLAFNTKNKPFDDKKVRQAFAYAIDKNFIINVLYGGYAQRSLGPIHPGSVFAPKDVNPYTLDLEKAKSLLDEAGYKPGADGVRIHTTLDYIPGGAAWKRKAEYVKAQLKKIGVDVTIKTSSDFRAWIKTVANHNFDMTLDSVFNWGDPVIGVHRTYQASNIRAGVPWHNTQQYVNPEVDKIMDEAGQELDQEKRKVLYQQMQKIVVDDAPIAYLHTSPYHTIYNNKRIGNPPVNSIWGVCAPWDEVYIK